MRSKYRNWASKPTLAPLYLPIPTECRSDKGVDMRTSTQAIEVEVGVPDRRPVLLPDYCLNVKGGTQCPKSKEEDDLER
jgi:hypothetical protein